jgi:hypothetical protein
MQDENKIRKIWLVSFIVILGANMVEDFITKSISLSIIFSPIISLLFFWVSYHCAYKKRGTFLLFVVIALSLVLLSIHLEGWIGLWNKDCVFWDKLNSSILTRLLAKIFIVYDIICCCTIIYFTFLSCKLCKINRIWQKKELAEREKQNKVFSNVS